MEENTTLVKRYAASCSLKATGEVSTHEEWRPRGEIIKDGNQSRGVETICTHTPFVLIPSKKCVKSNE